MGAQVYDYSTIDGYRHGLEQGGRCLEIDCWVKSSNLEWA